MVNQPGYVYVYLSNENDTPVEAYFDDFKVTHAKGPIVSSQDYYPFGLTFNSYQRENSLYNKYQYNGKEIQSELGLGWSDYGARMYMPEIGRWSAQDPHASNYFNFSPYTYCLNGPTNFQDPDGKDVIFTVTRNKAGEITGVKVSSTIYITGVGASEG